MKLVCNKSFVSFIDIYFLFIQFPRQSVWESVFPFLTKFIQIMILLVIYFPHSVVRSCSNRFCSMQWWPSITQWWALLKQWWPLLKQWCHCSNSGGHRSPSVQLGALCCNLELRKYQEVESSHLVTDYKHNLSLLNKSFLCLILSNLLKV